VFDGLDEITFRLKRFPSRYSGEGFRFQRGSPSQQHQRDKRKKINRKAVIYSIVENILANGERTVKEKDALDRVFLKSQEEIQSFRWMGVVVTSGSRDGSVLLL
jgi:hypothetical protein